MISLTFIHTIIQSIVHILITYCTFKMTSGDGDTLTFHPYYISRFTLLPVCVSRSMPLPLAPLSLFLCVLCAFALDARARAYGLDVRARASSLRRAHCVPTPHHFRSIAPVWSVFPAYFQSIPTHHPSRTPSYTFTASALLHSYFFPPYTPTTRTQIQKHKHSSPIHPPSRK